MLRRTARAAALLPVLFLAACSGLPEHQALVEVSIDSARTSKAEKAVKPLRDALVDYDFDGMFKDEIKASLSPVAWLAVGDVRVVRDVADASLDNDLTSSKAGAVLFTSADYHTSNDADVLYVTMHAALFANNDALRALHPTNKTPKTAFANTLYRDLITYETKLPNATDDRDANIAAWSADHGAAMRAALKQGAAKLGALVAYDLGNPGTVTPVAAKQQIKVDGIKLDVVGTDPDGDLARMKDDGALVYVTRSLL